MQAKQSEDISLSMKLVGAAAGAGFWLMAYLCFSEDMSKYLTSGRTALAGSVVATLGLQWVLGLIFAFIGLVCLFPLALGPLEAFDRATGLGKTKDQK